MHIQNTQWNGSIISAVVTQDRNSWRNIGLTHAMRAVWPASVLFHRWFRAEKGKVLLEDSIWEGWDTNNPFHIPQPPPNPSGFWHVSLFCSRPLFGLSAQIAAHFKQKMFSALFHWPHCISLVCLSRPVVWKKQNGFGHPGGKFGNNILSTDRSVFEKCSLHLWWWFSWPEVMNSLSCRKSSLVISVHISARKTFLQCDLRGYISLSLGINTGKLARKQKPLKQFLLHLSWILVQVDATPFLVWRTWKENCSPVLHWPKCRFYFDVLVSTAHATTRKVLLDRRTK